MLDDQELLSSLLESSKLTQDQTEAFERMLGDLKAHRFPRLSKRQRDWAEDLHARLGLDPGTENLVSSGKMSVTADERKGLQEFIASLGPKHLKPPGRRQL